MKILLLIGLFGLSGAALAAQSTASARPTASSVHAKFKKIAAKSSTSPNKASALPPPTSALNTTVVTKPPVEESHRISGLVSVGRSNSLYIENGESKSASWDFSGSLAYKINPVLTVTSLLDGSQDIKTPEESDFGRGLLGLQYHRTSGTQPLLDLTPYMKIGFPVSRSSRSTSLRNYLQAGLKTAVGSDYLFSKKLSLEVSVSGIRYIHDYDTSAAGKPNNQYSAAQGFTVGWNFTDALSLSFAYTHLNYWTYQGAMTEYFNHTEELGYQIDKSWTVAVGHSFGNPAVNVWHKDRETYNMDLTDGENSVVYAQIGYTF